MLAGVLLTGGKLRSRRPRCGYGFENAGSFGVNRSRPLGCIQRRTDDKWPRALGTIDIDARVNITRGERAIRIPRAIVLLVREVVRS